MNFGERIQNQLDASHEDQPITVVSLAVYPHGSDTVEVVALVNGAYMPDKTVIQVMEVVRRQLLDKIMREQFINPTASPWPDISQENDGR